MSIQRWEMDPRSGKYAEPMGVELAVTILSEMVDEWSWDDDPHGYCHTRRPIVALLNAYEDHVAALEQAKARARWFAERADEWKAKAKPRTIGPDDPEPAVGSVVLDNAGHPDRWAYQRDEDGYWCHGVDRWTWAHLLIKNSPGSLTLIHDGGRG